MTTPRNTTQAGGDGGGAQYAHMTGTVDGIERSSGAE